MDFSWPRMVAELKAENQSHSKLKERPAGAPLPPKGMLGNARVGPAIVILHPPGNIKKET